MSNVVWLLEEKIVPDSFIEELQKTNTVNIKVNSNGPVDYLKVTEVPSVYYGGIQGSNRILKQTTNVPGSYCNLPKYNCSAYYPELKGCLFNEDYTFIPFKCLLDFRNRVWKEYPSGFFCRPNSGNKCFTGQIIKTVEEVRNIDKELEPDTMCLVSSIKPVKWEQRYVIVDDKVITGSTYNLLNEPEVEIQNLRLAELVLDYFDYRPDSAFALDLCVEDNCVFSVMELNAFSTSGLYACNLAKIIKAINALAEKEFKEYHDVLKIGN